MLTASYAKINLHLEVTGKLPDNYHQVNTILCGIDLCDFISYELISEPVVKFSCSNPELDNPDNLVCRIANHLHKEFRVPRGIKIHLEKVIPVAAGLGGGSGNAANCLLNLNKLWDLRLSENKLHILAAKFGSDLNYFLIGGTAKGTYRGEQISRMPYIPIDSILLVNPGLKISAAEAYKLVHIPDETEVKLFDPANWQETAFNRLEPGVRAVYPEIAGILSKLSECNAKPAIMSGSGSTCFGVFTDQKLMRDCQAHFSRLGYWTFLTRSIPVFN